jgi:hypothetical protein
MATSSFEIVRIPAVYVYIFSIAVSLSVVNKPDCKELWKLYWSYVCKENENKEASEIEQRRLNKAFQSLNCLVVGVQPMTCLLFKIDPLALGKYADVLWR